MPCMSANGHKPFAALLGFCLQLLLSGVAQGDDARLEGQKLAWVLCSGCHVIAEGQGGPVVDGVPSFPEIARSEISDARLRGWLAVPHPVMPQMPLSARETEAVIVYIRSFAD